MGFGEECRGSGLGVDGGGLGLGLGLGSGRYHRWLSEVRLGWGVERGEGGLGGIRGIRQGRGMIRIARARGALAGLAIPKVSGICEKRWPDFLGYAHLPHAKYRN